MNLPSHGRERAEHAIPAYPESIIFYFSSRNFFMW